MAFCAQLVDAAKACLPEQEPLDRSNYLKGIFRTIDKDGGGTLDLEEFKAVAAKQSTKSLLVQEEVFKMMDINKDGVISQAEFVIFQMEYGHELSDADFKKHGDSWIAMAAHA